MTQGKQISCYSNTCRFARILVLERTNKEQEITEMQRRTTLSGLPAQLNGMNEM